MYWTKTIRLGLGLAPGTQGAVARIPGRGGPDPGSAGRPRRARMTMVVTMLLMASLSSGGARGLSAQEAGLAALVSEADRANPRIAAARRIAEAAAARVPQAGALPDPTVGVGLMNVPVADPSLGRNMMTMAHLQVGGRLPWPGKLGLREAVARLEAEGAAWEAEGVRQEVRAEVKSAYYRIYFIDHALRITGHNERLVGDFARLTSSKYAVGSGAQPDVLKAQVERTRLEDQLVRLREQRTSTLARLNALLARPTDTPLPAVDLPDEVRVAALPAHRDRTRFASAALADVAPEGDGDGALPPTAELQEAARANNARVRAHTRRVAARQEALALARRAELPDVSVSVGYSHRGGLGDLFNVMVSTPVPIFSSRKQDQAVVEHAAHLAEHRARHDAMVDELDAEIASLSEEFRRARDQLVLLNEGILPQARTALSSATASYHVGRVDFLTLLDAQITLYQQELDYHRLLADFATDLAALERAVGTEVLR